MSVEGPRTRPAGPRRGGGLVDLAIELSLGAGGLLLLARILLRGLWHPPFGWWVPPLVVGGLLALRVRRGVHRREGAGWRPGRWLAGLRAPGLVLAGCFLVVIALLPPTGSTLGPDGGKYLGQMGAVLLRGRLIGHLGIEPGVTILQAPFFLLGHAVALAVSAVGGETAVDGWSVTYTNALRLGSAVYGFLAAVLAWVACRRFFPPVFAAVCVGGAWLSSTLFHYSVAEPGMAHAPGAALASLLLVLWLGVREEPEHIARWVAVALAGGLLVATQRYDAYLLLPPVVTGAAVLSARWQTGNGAARRRALLASLGVVAAFALASLPLVLVSFAAPGGFLLDPETIRTSMLARWSRPHIGEILFSSNGGLFSWTPVALLGVLGLVLFLRRERRLALILLATLALGVVVLGSNPTWWAGWSFGARRLTEAFAILTLGFCAFAAAAIERPRALGAVALGALVVVNLSLSSQYRRDALAPIDTLSFTRAMQGVVAEAYGLVGHPPSWPANWLFAARYGIGPDRFDDLYGQVPRDQWQVRLGTLQDAAILGRGWSRPHGQAPDRQRWALAEEATLLFTLPAPADRRLLLRAAAARRAEGPAQGLAIEVNGSPAGRFTLAPSVRSVAMVLPARLWSEGLNEVRFRPEWSLSRRQAWETGQPAYGAWRLEEIRLEPAGP